MNKKFYKVPFTGYVILKAENETIALGRAKIAIDCGPRDETITYCIGPEDAVKGLE